MLSALEKVIYPNGKTKALGDIVSGSVSSIIDEVHSNTSAIESINKALLKINAGIANLDLNREVNPYYEGVDLTEFFSEEIAEFSDEWAWINNRVQTGNFLGLHVGDYIPVVTSETTPRTFKAIIMGINTYKNMLQTPMGNHIDWTFDKVWGAVKANLAQYNNGISSMGSPYMCSNMNYFMNSKSGEVPNGTGVNPTMESVDYTSGGILHFLPEKLKAVITPKVIAAPTRYNSQNILTDDASTMWMTSDKLWTPFITEITGNDMFVSNGFSIVGMVQYELFRNGRMRSRYDHSETRRSYWTASASSRDSSKFVAFSSSGTGSITLATDTEVTVVPCFRTAGVTLTSKKKAVAKKKGDSK